MRREEEEEEAAAAADKVAAASTASEGRLPLAGPRWGGARPARSQRVASDVTPEHAERRRAPVLRGRRGER